MTLAALLPEPEFLSWGWHISFVISLALLGIGLFVRNRVGESPLFKELVAESEQLKDRRPPIIETLRRPHTVLLVALVRTAHSHCRASRPATAWHSLLAME